MGLAQTTAPTCEPVTLATAKAHCRYEGEEENDLILTYIRAARKYLEDITGRQLINATWTWKLDEFPDDEDPIYFPRTPLSSVTSIQYIDTAGATQTWSNTLYDVDTSSTPGRVMCAYGQNYPITRSDMDAVTIVFVAGYGTTPADIPDEDQVYILRKVVELYEDRGNEPTPLSAVRATNSLLWANRVEVV